jgi:uncharacterized LabA/DUF88 family protein
MELEKIHYLFIDGGYLNSIIDHYRQNFFNVDEINIDFRKISKLMFSDENFTYIFNYKKVFYYDCLPVNNKDENENLFESRRKKKEELFNKIRSFKGFHVHEGKLKKKKDKIIQKEIDVKIAVDMLMHTVRGNMHEATLLAGDRDFKPLVEALVQEGLFVHLLHDPKFTSRELIYAADNSITIDYEYIYNLTDQTFKKEFKLPNTLSSSGPPGHLESNVKNKDGDIAQLYVAGNQYYLKYKNLYYQHTRSDFLKRFLKYIEPKFENMEWD